MPSSSDQSSKTNRGPAAGPANRRALIAAARAIFAEEGLGAPLSGIVRRAGVGRGSLYRHFSDRIDLGVAVFDENIAELELFAAPAERTLDDLLDLIVAQATSSTMMIELVNSHRHDPRVAHLRGRFRAIVAALLAREQAAGRVEANLDPEDVILATGMLAAELARTDPPDRPAVARRARSLFGRAFAHDA